MRTARPLALLLLTARAASSDAPAALADARPDDPRLRQLLSPYERDGVFYSYSFVDTPTLSVSVSLTLSGIACSGFGVDEEAVLRTALTSTLDLASSSYVGAMDCADGRRLSSSATVSFDIDIPADEVADDAVADGADLATTVAATLETAISDGSFATAIASAATSLSVSSMSAVSATGVSVDTQMPTPAPTTPEQTPAPEKRHAARSSLGRWLGRACSQASCVGPASSFDDHTVRMGFRRGHSSHHAGVSMATVRHYFAQTVSRTRRGATSS